MYAIGVKDGTRPNACIVNTVMQISKATPADAPMGIKEFWCIFSR